MGELRLIRPSMQWKKQALDYLEEHRAMGEFVIHGGALLEAMPYEDWLKQTLDNAKQETVHADWVLADTFFVVDSTTDTLIGMIDIRHELNEFLASYGGHIGYGVRPSQRKKGCGAVLLRMALQHAASLGLTQVMLACDEENAASRATILKCGGLLNNTVRYQDQSIVQVFWIPLG